MEGSLDPITMAAIVLDLDGVVIDSLPVIERAWREVAARHGRELTDADIVQHVHGRHGQHTLAALFPDRPSAEQQSIWAHVDRIEEEAAYRPIGGVQAFIGDTRRGGIPTALVTSSWPRKIDRALRLLDVADAFAVVVSREDVRRGKPFPDPYLTACSRLGVPPARALVFEDSTSGVESALAAGALCVRIHGDAGVHRPGVVATIPDFTSLRLRPAGPGRYLLHGVPRPIVVLSRS